MEGRNKAQKSLSAGLGHEFNPQTFGQKMSGLHLLLPVGAGGN